MADIKCPMCAKINPSDLDECKFCNARLKPLTDELSRSQPPIRPGDQPKPIDTDELEPVLPQWLRKVRQQNRDSADENAQKELEKEEKAAPKDNVDLLAGLQSQSDINEEVPDWLAEMRSGGDQNTLEEISPKEHDQASSNIISKEEPLEAGKGEASTLPGWISDLGTSELDSKTDKVNQSETFPSPAEEKSSAMDFELGAEPEVSSSFLKDATDSISSNLSGLEDNSLSPQNPVSEEPSQSIEADSDLPDWLATIEEKNAKNSVMQEPAQPELTKGESEQILTNGEDPNTLAQQAAGQLSSENKVPDWLSSTGEEAASAQESLAKSESNDLQKPASDLPEAFSSTDKESREPDPGQDLPTDNLSGGIDGETTIAENEPVDLQNKEVDAIFSTDMPDWISEIGTEIKKEDGATPGEAQDLDPVDLPNWVQAMRPLESVFSESDSENLGDQTLEEQGPLAGLRGVLPAVRGAGPSSKPKAYSIKLKASEDQQTSAALLEEMLAKEINPKPINTQPVILTQRIQRWGITFLLGVTIFGTIFAGTQIIPMPTTAPFETSAAMRYIQEDMPADAPILIIFDYDAALAAEMEAVAGPIVDHMLLLKQPRMGLVSSNPIGSALAERFMAFPQANHNYQSGQNFTNLGYLPGGAAGVLAFSENPAAIKPFSVNGEPAWETPVLQDVKQLSDFAAIILLTSDLESARTWIEQTENTRGESNFLVISSAQSGPMILPYVQSGQVDGLITGLNGSAPIEQVNSGRPGTIRLYWDAYSLGLLTAVMLITFGSLWNLVSGWQMRRKNSIET